MLFRGKKVCYNGGMSDLRHLFENNKAFAERKGEKVFKGLAKGQSPKYLYLGCSDSRIPAEEILGLSPGEVFVHRNVANLCPHTDFNCLSVLQYGVEHLEIEDIIVCGHYGCGGIAAAMEKAQYGLLDNWLRHIRDVISKEKETLEKIEDKQQRYNRLVELNVIYQVMSVCHTTIVQNAWKKGKPVAVHGWVFDVKTGLIKDLKCTISSLEQVDEIYKTLDLH